MGIFDQITNALSGKPAPAPNPGSGSGPQKAQGDFDEDMAIRHRNLQAMGLDDNGDPIKKPLPTMHDHADALHPVPKKGK